MRIVAKPPAMPQEQPAAVVDVEVEEVDVEITAPDGQPEVVVDVEEVDVWAEEAVDDRAPEIGEEVVLSDIHLLEETQTYFNYKAAVDFGLNIAKGNTDSGNINLSAMVAPSWGKNTITIDGQMNKGQSDGDNTISNWRIKGIYEREVYRRWFFGVINAWQQDSFQDLNLRLTAGAGVAHTVFDEPRLFGESTFLKVGLFPAVVNENFRGSDDDDTYAALVWKLDSSQDLYTDDINFYHNHQLTIGLSKSAAIWLTTTGFKFDLIDDFALLLEFQYDLNTEPANDAKKSDYRYLVKLAYDFEGNQRDWFH
jgi:putative salt-induced outer membrane protein YdiY